MKYMYSLAILLFAVVFQVQAQSDKATVYLIRPAGADNYVPYFTYLDQTLLCKLGNGKFSVHAADPGEHKIHTQYKGKIKSEPETELIVQFEAGKTYYISVNLETKAFGKGRFFCEQMTEEVGKKYIAAYKEDKECL